MSVSCRKIVKCAYGEVVQYTYREDGGTQLGVALQFVLFDFSFFLADVSVQRCWGPHPRTLALFNTLTHCIITTDSNATLPDFAYDWCPPYYPHEADFALLNLPNYVKDDPAEDDEIFYYLYERCSWRNYCYYYIPNYYYYYKDSV